MTCALLPLALFQPSFTHTYIFNTYTHMDNFRCLISKYKEYGNIFLSNWSDKFCNKNFQPKT